MTDIDSLIAELRAEADVASRAGQTETLHRIASRIEREVAEVKAEALREAQDELVRRDAFTERSLRVLDELIEKGEGRG